MKLNELSARPGATKAKRRVGRGIGSGKGKTAGSGHKGQNSRSGVSLNGFEGGQMPFYRRMPKRGFTNIFRKEYEILNVGQLQKAVDDGQLDAKNMVDEAALKASKLVRGSSDGVRILAKGELTVALQIDVAGASKAAMAAIENAGGKITVRPAKILPADSKKSIRRAARKIYKTDDEAAAPAKTQTGDGKAS
ncbi:MAG: 50S ribosomal protein L15 [Proteobacteria bacterium]|nr:50S ribosomal protein L15 [Pseudomonadota bacterium]MDA1355076.1 50S ribosomal protein L15 [Pseudomonadota bacterium]